MKISVFSVVDCQEFGQRQTTDETTMFRFSLFLLYMLIFYQSVNPDKHKYGSETEVDRLLNVKVCPKMPIMKNVTKEKLLGFWYCYATTPLPFERYQRRCASYNVKDSPYFNTSILYTDYHAITITYFCDYIKEKETFRRKLRILTRTRTPMYSTILDATVFLLNENFPIKTLVFLRSEAYCFEWYTLKFETALRPVNFEAPFNQRDY
ncbi:hypothetical protein ACLKA6_019353 [Drosophila palustris]